jgi:hypothetical protein
LKNKIFSSTLKNAGVVDVNLEVAGLAPDKGKMRHLSFPFFQRISFASPQSPEMANSQNRPSKSGM